MKLAGLIWKEYKHYKVNTIDIYKSKYKDRPLKLEIRKIKNKYEAYLFIGEVTDTELIRYASFIHGEQGWKYGLNGRNYKNDKDTPFFKTIVEIAYLEMIAGRL